MRQVHFCFFALFRRSLFLRTVRGPGVSAPPGGDITYAFAASEDSLFLSPRARIQAGARQRTGAQVPPHQVVTSAQASAVLRPLCPPLLASR